jgi:hypothetical protein
MSKMTALSIEILPVELLHRIFDNLDTETIFLSVRLVSKFFQLVVNTYDRYILNFKLIFKPNFYLFCRLIHPNNVISLTFSNEYRIRDEIALFISFNRLQEYTRLRSLNLLNIDEDQLNIILEKIDLNLLTSFSFNINKYDDTCKEITTNHLSSIITKPTLRKLEFNIYNGRMSQISWPTDSMIQYLTINRFITMDNLSRIFQYSPHLHTLIMSEMLSGLINNLTSKCFRQLKSLTIEKISVTNDELESFLLLIPSLVHLKLINETKLMNGKQWEQFIQFNLPHLDKFEFYFKASTSNKASTDVELIINSFQTPFWIEYKKWFIICVQTLVYPHTIELYTIPIIKSSMCYRSELYMNSWSTHSTMMNKDPSIMNNIHSLDLILNKSIVDYIEENVSYLNKIVTFK